MNNKMNNKFKELKDAEHVAKAAYNVAMETDIIHDDNPDFDAYYAARAAFDAYHAAYNAYCAALDDHIAYI